MKLAAFLVVISFQLVKAETKYPANEIPENLRTGMYAVKREETVRFEIQSMSRSMLYMHYAITILNENGKRYANEVLSYDKLTKITTFKGTAYDANGNVIKKLKQNEIYDQSAISGFSIYEDDRLKSADLSQTTYPYTVEFEYEIQMNYLFSIPGFYLYQDDEVSTQRTSYSVVFPKSLTPRFKLTNIKEGARSQRDGKEALTWEFENIIPSKFESYSPALSKTVPNILVAPVDFEYDGHSGKMDSWENLGKWNVQLNNGRDALPEVTAQRVIALTKDAKTTEEKVAILYEYLQNNTRYVSIQLGIGGFQPMEAKVVDEMKYGDCKALSNYMISMLKVAGVKANYVLIHAGDDDGAIPADFPIKKFNHVIVAVPNQKDTLWLECTSQTNPFGYMGSFTGDRYALMITDNGGRLVRTISYAANQNQQVRNAEVTIGLTGDGMAKVATQYSGLQYENDDLYAIVRKSAEEQKKWIQKNTHIPVFDVNTFSITELKKKIPMATVQVDLSMRKYATVSGKRLFLVPNFMNRYSGTYNKVESRKNNVVRHLAYTDIDTVRFNLPETLYPEFLPPPVKIESRFGVYESSITLDQGKLLYVRRVRMNKGEFPPESYNEMMDFYKNMSKADNAKVVFLSKT